jgi:hypothetical protein
MAPFRVAPAVHPAPAAPSTSTNLGTEGEPIGGALTPRSRTAARETRGRWAKERYDAAQAALVRIMTALQATSPDRAILRPALREEARRVIGDTGLLDHLLKHLADAVVTEAGDRLRRRHNREGHMVFWLQSPAAAQEGEAGRLFLLLCISSFLRVCIILTAVL